MNSARDIKSAQFLLSKWETATLEDFKAFWAESDAWLKATIKTHNDDWNVDPLRCSSCQNVMRIVSVNPRAIPGMLYGSNTFIHRFNYSKRANRISVGFTWVSHGVAVRRRSDRKHWVSTRVVLRWATMALQSELRCQGYWRARLAPGFWT